MQINEVPTHEWRNVLGFGDMQLWRYLGKNRLYTVTHDTRYPELGFNAMFIKVGTGDADDIVRKAPTLEAAQAACETHLFRVAKGSTPCSQSQLNISGTKTA